MAKLRSVFAEVSPVIDAAFAEVDCGCNASHAAPVLKEWSRYFQTHSNKCPSTGIALEPGM